MTTFKEVTDKGGNSFFVLEGLPAMEASRYMHIGDFLEEPDGFRVVVDHRVWRRDVDGYVVAIYFVAAPESDA